MSLLVTLAVQATASIGDAALPPTQPLCVAATVAGGVYKRWTQAGRPTASNLCPGWALGLSRPVVPRSCAHPCRALADTIPPFRGNWLARQLRNACPQQVTNGAAIITDLAPHTHEERTKAAVVKMGYMLLLLVETEKRGKQTHQEQRACDQG